jgi:hypothetical protein
LCCAPGVILIVAQHERTDYGAHIVLRGISSLERDLVLCRYFAALLYEAEYRLSMRALWIHSVVFIGYVDGDFDT